ncbi:MAG: type II secretion system F family protein [Lentisphaeria bacterium]
MSQLKNRIHFYHNLSTLLDAGLSLDHALRQRYPKPFYKISERMRRSLQNGAQFSEAMKESGHFSNFECNLVAAGETGGHLPSILASLDSWFTQSMKLRQKIINGMMLPLFIFVFSLLIIAVIDVFAKHVPPAQAMVATLLRIGIPALILLFLKFFVSCFWHTAFMGHLIEPIPVFGSLQHKLETARFFKSFSICMSSGIPIQRSIRLSANCCKNAAYVNRYLRLIPLIQNQGKTFCDAFNEIQNRRDTYSPIPAMLNTGEVSGQLDVFSERISNLLTNEASQLLEKLAFFVPQIFYLAIMIYIAIQIITLFSNLIIDPIKELL